MTTKGAMMHAAIVDTASVLGLGAASSDAAITLAEQLLPIDVGIGQDWSLVDRELAVLGFIGRIRCPQDAGERLADQQGQAPCGLPPAPSSTAPLPSDAATQGQRFSAQRPSRGVISKELLAGLQGIMPRMNILLMYVGGFVIPSELERHADERAIHVHALQCIARLEVVVEVAPGGERQTPVEAVAHARVDLPVYIGIIWYEV
jgi:hypothetical protein